MALSATDRQKFYRHKIKQMQGKAQLTIFVSKDIKAYLDSERKRTGETLSQVTERLLSSVTGYVTEKPEPKTDIETITVTGDKPEKPNGKRTKPKGDKQVQTNGNHMPEKVTGDVTGGEPERPVSEMKKDTSDVTGDATLAEIKSQIDAGKTAHDLEPEIDAWIKKQAKAGRTSVDIVDTLNKAGVPNCHKRYRKNPRPWSQSTMDRRIFALCGPRRTKSG